ncbi:hypothetical protein GCM10009715_33650 [Paeniglutamicibacter psychrophenolicus]|uniref:ATP-binding protein n=1 Tax=Paeniglutamicibacter psychrophenolicus TaxID=257454 RepID=A0ABS4W9R6_9MICC|nr:ATP-binding protein [Paeniglutamicibacter psychrophenolicus]MBP2372951.1 hypothetical protein [Paeniglutamicibacter psychrophenolicus]
MTTIENRDFSITVLGRTLEHLGTQMYKRRDVAIAELVANAWDAGAQNVHLSIPLKSDYNQASSKVIVKDDGQGMSPDEVQDNYLVIGRNRRSAGQEPPGSRRPMGRKGVGKLAGFGLGTRMDVLTATQNAATSLALNGADLTERGGKTKRLELPGTVTLLDEDASTTGTTITLSTLKHKTPPDIAGLHQSLSRRFSRTVLGEMKIFINEEPLQPFEVTFTKRDPAVGEDTATLECGNSVTWWAGFSDKVLSAEMQGFTILVNGKTAQAPAFFFNVEATASGQHGTKYLTGVIEADYLDNGTDDESDLVSTDRQDLDWDSEATESLMKWGQAQTRKLLRERLEDGERQAVATAESDPDLAGRLARLDPTSRKQANKFIMTLGRTDANPERVRELAGTIVRAFEYRQFHDYIEELEKVSEDPASLTEAIGYLSGWRVLESRAVLEVIKGRLGIVDKFFDMIIKDSPETASSKSDDNMHDLLARYPWLINPDWQVLSEEKTITNQLKEWNAEFVPEADRSRYDFLALEGNGETIIIEIKRAGHAVNMEDLMQLEKYVYKLEGAREKIRGVFITADRYAVSERIIDRWNERADMELLTWSTVQKRTSSHYQHYAAVLNSDIDEDSFDRKKKEVSQTRQVLSTSTRRTPEERRSGVGPSDIEFLEPALESLYDSLNQETSIVGISDTSNETISDASLGTS